MKALYLFLLVLIIMGLTTSCNSLSTQAKPDSPRVITIDGQAYAEDEYTSFRCFKNLLSTKVLVEVGILNIEKDNMNGFILFDGGNTGDLVSYKRAGLNHRWNWDKVNDNYKYSFVIDPEGNGAYYDFTAAKNETTIDAKQTYKCKRSVK